MMHTLPVALLGALLAAVAAEAQTPLPTIPSTPGSFVEGERHDDGRFLGSTSIRRGLYGRISGHGLPDVVFGDGQRVWIAAAPGIHQSTGPIGVGSDWQDVAVLHDANGPGHDSLALVDASGLSIWTFDPGSEPFEFSVAGGFAGAERLATTADDPSVVFALAADGVTVMKASRGGRVVGSANVLAVSGAPVLDIVACDIDADGNAEIAIVTADSVTVRTQAGAVVAATAVVGPAEVESAVRVRMATGGDWVVALCSTSGLTQELRVLRHGVPVAAVPLGHTAYVAVSAGRVTPDDNDDLCLVEPNHQTVSVLYNSFPFEAAGFAHNAAVGVAVECASSVERAPSAMAPVIADFDGDGDGDMLAVVEASEDVRHQMLLRPNWIANQPAATLEGPLGWEEVASTGGPVTNVSFGYTMNPGVAQLAEVLVWPVDASSELQLEMHPAPIRRLLLPNAGEKVELTLDSSGFDTGYYAFAIRPVTVAGPGNAVVVAGPALLGAIWKRTDLAAFFPVTGGGLANIEDGNRIGGVEPYRPLPPLPPEEEDPPAPQPPGGS